VILEAGRYRPAQVLCRAASEASLLFVATRGHHTMNLLR